MNAMQLLNRIVNEGSYQSYTLADALMQRLTSLPICLDRRSVRLGKGLVVRVRWGAGNLETVSTLHLSKDKGVLVVEPLKLNTTGLPPTAYEGLVADLRRRLGSRDTMRGEFLKTLVLDPPPPRPTMMDIPVRHQVPPTSDPCYLVFNDPRE